MSRMLIHPGETPYQVWLTDAYAKILLNALDFSAREGGLHCPPELVEMLERVASGG